LPVLYGCLQLRLAAVVLELIGWLVKYFEHGYWQLISLNLVRSAGHGLDQMRLILSWAFSASCIDEVWVQKKHSRKKAANI